MWLHSKKDSKISSLLSSSSSFQKSLLAVVSAGNCGLRYKTPSSRLMPRSRNLACGTFYSLLCPPPSWVRFSPGALLRLLPLLLFRPVSATCRRAASPRSWPTWILMTYAGWRGWIGPSEARPGLISSGNRSSRIITRLSSGKCPVDRLKNWAWANERFTRGSAAQVT